MDLSIIIVNYNVKHFLEQCLCSVEKAVAGLDAEVIVVDNHSTDGSVGYLQPAFPNVQFIASKENLGFGKANNLALKLAKGKFILFLNPDTIVPEDCFAKCISFFDANKDCGALGIKMIDGSGNFLPESKRSFPSVLTSFYKLAGFSSIFPKSGVFNRYALGHLDENQNHEVDVLCGAFMMLTKEAADKTKGFDEDFFMYGEDIDLSYRIQKLGLKNYYFAESCIIHFKGESAGQQGFKHNKMFYEAMMVFVRKHYGMGKKGVFAVNLKIAILLRSLIGYWKYFFRPFNYMDERLKVSHDFFYMECRDGKYELMEDFEGELMKVDEGINPFDLLKQTVSANLVFHEGDCLTNRTIIQLVQESANQNKYWFHSNNSRAKVSSPSKNNSGTVIEYASTNK
jgi:GT2 family glycosyltransferase